MAEPFLSEIRVFSFHYPPKGWAMCNGQILPINQNQALFALLGTTYGGDGRVNFALPELRGRTPVHWGDGSTLGERAGVEAHTLTASEMPAHNHLVRATSDAGNASAPANGRPGKERKGLANPYGASVPNAAMHPSTIAPAGGSQPHSNMQPSFALNFCIALQGIFPSQP